MERGGMLRIVKDRTFHLVLAHFIELFEIPEN
jgi:hypothetical protein